MTVPNLSQVTVANAEQKKSPKSHLTAATKKKTSLITNIKNFLNLNLSQNVTLSIALSVFLVCSICMKTIPFATPFYPTFVFLSHRPHHHTTPSFQHPLPPFH